jgi:hypothetical protein
VDDLGLHALEPQWPAGRFRPPVERKAVPVDEKTLQSYAGEYELQPGFTLMVTVDSGELSMRATGQAQFKYLPLSATEFIHKMADIRIKFVKNTSGVVTHLMIYQDGFEREAKKIK